MAAKKRGSKKKTKNKKRTTPERDKATRSDLVCERCEEKFKGKIGTTVCPDCVTATSPGDMPDVVPTLEEQETARDEEKGKPYEKQVHVDESRERYEGRQPREVGSRAGLDKIAKEDEKGKARRDPLRDKLKKLDAKIASFETEIKELKQQRLDLIADLRPQEGEMDKMCFGKGYDPKSYECTSLCPLVTECVAICGPEKRTLVVGSVRDI